MGLSQATPISDEKWPPTLRDLLAIATLRALESQRGRVLVLGGAPPGWHANPVERDLRKIPQNMVKWVSNLPLGIEKNTCGRFRWLRKC